MLKPTDLDFQTDANFVNQNAIMMEKRFLYLFNSDAEKPPFFLFTHSSLFIVSRVSTYWSCHLDDEVFSCKSQTILTSVPNVERRLFFFSELEYHGVVWSITLSSLLIWYERCWGSFRSSHNQAVLSPDNNLIWSVVMWTSSLFPGINK